MIELLNQLDSWLNLFSRGLEKILDKIKLERRKDIYRRIVTIKLLLEEIIDGALEIFSVIKTSGGKISEKERGNLLRLFNIIVERIDMLILYLHDVKTHEILELFPLEIRGKLPTLIYPKRNIIEWRIHLLYSENLTFNKLQEKEKVIRSLTESSKKLSQFINQHIKLEDIIQ